MIKTIVDHTDYKSQNFPSISKGGAESYLKNKPKRHGSARSIVQADFGIKNKGFEQTNSHYFHQAVFRKYKIEFYGLEFIFPIQLRGFYKALKESVEILSLEDNWDGEGAHKIDENTWLRAINFLDIYARRVYEMDNVVLDEPFISPVPNGSVDVVWEKKKVRLLLNFKIDYEVAGFYGDFYSDNHTFKGNISTSGTIDYFAFWLKNFEKDG